MSGELFTGSSGGGDVPPSHLPVAEPRDGTLEEGGKGVGERSNSG